MGKYHSRENKLKRKMRCSYYKIDILFSAVTCKKSAPTKRLFGPATNKKRSCFSSYLAFVETKISNCVVEVIQFDRKGSQTRSTHLEYHVITQLFLSGYVYSA